MQKYQNAIQDLKGNAIAGASINVYLYGTLTTATIYSDNGVTPITPGSLTTDPEGEFGFYAANGRYTVSVVATGFTSQNFYDVLLFDPADAGITSVANYGAVADGVTDNTAAFQAAIDAAYAAGGGYIQIPLNGSYRINGTVVLKSGVVLGNVAGTWDTYSTYTTNNQPATAKLLKYGTGDCFTFYHGATGATTYAGGGLIGISVDGSNQTSGGGIYFTSPTAADSFGCVIRNCIFEKCYAYGIKVPVSTYAMRDVRFIDCEVEGTRSVATSEGSGLINQSTDTNVNGCLFFRNARHGIENTGGAVRLVNTDSFYNTLDGVYDAGQATKALYVQCDANGRYGLFLDVSATYAAAGRQSVYSSCLFWKNNTSNAANGRNVNIGQTSGGAGLHNIGFTSTVFGAGSAETVEYHLAISALPNGQNRFVGCQFSETTSTTGKAMNDNLRKTSIFAGNSTGTEEYFRMPTVLASGTTLPSVQNSSILQTANAAPTTITNFLVGRVGQTIKVLFGDANTTVDFTGTNLKGRATDWTPGVGDSMECTTPDGTTWYCITSG